MYIHLLSPINGMNLWQRTPYNPPLPPEMEKQRSRPKDKRIRDKDENVNLFRSSKNNVIMTCRRCGQPGHNMRTCRGVTMDKSYLLQML